MSFSAWREWLGSLPWMLRWFPLLVLLRPVIDNLYFLKEVSPLLSPPYIVGVLTPLLCIAAMVKYKLPKMKTTEKSFAIWAACLCLAAFLVLLHDPFSLVSIEFVLKLSMPVYLFFFLRVFIRDLRDLHGILTTILYAAVFVALLLLYEIFISPISVEESRGLQRIQGSFGDVVSYGMYIIFTTLITLYYFFARQHILAASRLVWLVALVAMINMLGLVNIHHTATYSVFIMLFGLSFLTNMRTKYRTVSFAILIGLGIVFSFLGSELITEKITPLLETDLAVYQGEKDSDQLFHGRVGRWRLMLQNFSAESVHIQFFGLPLKFEPVFPYIGIGSHNDIFRIMFATGFVGLFFYLRFLWLISRHSKRLGRAQQFLLEGVLLSMLLYSISVTPTFYAPFMYFALSVFAYVLLPENQRSSWNGHPY